MDHVKQRDYASEMLCVLNTTFANAATVDCRSLARNLVKKLLETDKELLSGYVSLRAEDLIYRELRLMAQARRRSSIREERQKAGNAVKTLEGARKWLEEMRLKRAK
jgi:hypothetical protein